MFIVFFRALLLYAVIVICIRLMGKRQIGELQPGELVVTIMLSNIATLPIEDPDIPVLMGLIPIFTIVCMDIFMSYLSMTSRRVRRLVSGSPKILISGGRINQRTMRSLRFTADDLFESLRSQQVFDIADVQLAIVETTGQISVYVKKESSPLTPQDMGQKPEESDPPVMVIDNGCVVSEGMEFIRCDEKWLSNIMKKEQLDIKDIFIMTADKDKKYNIIKKE